MLQSGSAKWKRRHSCRIATSKNFKIMNTQFQKKAGRRWTWRSPDGNTKNEIGYIMTDKPSMVTDVTVINRVNIGSDHRMVMGSITLNTRAERRKLLNKNTRTRVDTQIIGMKKNTFQLELKNRFTALEEHDDMDSLNKNMTGQLSHLFVARSGPPLVATPSELWCNRQDGGCLCPAKWRLGLACQVTVPFLFESIQHILWHLSSFGTSW